MAGDEVDEGRPCADRSSGQSTVMVVVGLDRSGGEGEVGEVERVRSGSGCRAWAAVQLGRAGTSPKKIRQKG